MANNNLTSDDWVDSRLATLKAATDKKFNTLRALAILRTREQRASTTRRNYGWAAATASVILVSLLALPGTRGIAQRLWDSVFLGRIEIVRVNFDDLPEELRSFHAEIMTGPGKQEVVRDSDEAEVKAGFRPALPGARALGGTPRLSVISTIGARLTIRRQELLAAVDQAGASDIEVPQSWDGTSLDLRVGPIVQADYRDASLLQCRPIVLVGPPDFDVAHLVEVMFRILGVSRQDARLLSEKFSANPAWFLGIPHDDEVTIEEVSLRSGRGMYVEDFNEQGRSERAALVWSTSDRVYALSGNMSREQAILVADTIN